MLLKYAKIANQLNTIGLFTIHLVGVTAQVISTANGVATITICGVDKSIIISVISAISNGYIAVSENVLDFNFN